MYHTILVPLDGSVIAEAALPSAVALAQKMGARLVLVRVVAQPSLTTSELNEPQVEISTDAEMYLADVASMLNLQHGLRVDTAVLYGPAVDGIMLEIQQSAADIIVMTTHGRSGLGRWVYGSVAESVLHRSPVPIWLVRAGQNDTPVVAMPHPRILVPLDGSPFSEAALPHAKEVARAFDGTLVLLHVVEPPIITEDVTIQSDYLEEELLQAQLESAQKYIRGLADTIAEQDCPVETLIRNGLVVNVIVKECQQANVGLVVMTTHGRTGLGRTILGSVAMDVLRFSSLPVLLVRPSDHPEHLQTAVATPVAG